MKGTIHASGLKGFAFVVFEQMLFIQYNPDATLLKRLDMLENLFALVRAKHMDGEFKTEITTLKEDIDSLRADHAPVDGQEWNIRFCSDFRMRLDALQLNLYRVIALLKIIDSVTMGDGQWTED